MVSIEKIRGMFYPTCDSCGAELPPADDFYEAVGAKKDAGWKSRKYGVDWVDTCPDCQETEDE